MEKQNFSTQRFVMKVGRSISFCLLAILALTILHFNAQTASVQEEANTDIHTLIAKWKDLEAELATKAAILDAEPNPEVTEEYRDLVEQANTLIGEMKEKSGEALLENPDDIEVLRTVIGIMVNDAAFGRDAEVLRVGDKLIAAGVNPRVYQLARSADRLPIDSRHVFDELFIRDSEARSDDLPQVKLETSQGDILIELFENEAPNTVANFISLIDAEFYDGLTFHRVMENFMAQGGCPDGTGGGGPGYSIACECYEPDHRRHFTGSLSMGKSPEGRDTGGSQFFLTFMQTSHLDGQHTVFGRVIEGQEVLDQITRTYVPSPYSPGGELIPDAVADRIISATVIRRRDHEYVPATIGGDPLPSVETPVVDDAVDEFGDEGGADDIGNDGNTPGTG